MNDHDKKVMFSSADTGGSDSWETPLTTFLPLDAEFRFTLDAAASAENAKVAKYFTEQDDALRQEWAPNTVWVNPPYSEAEAVCSPNCKKKRCKQRGHCNTKYKAGQDDFVVKAWAEAQKGATVVMLLPSRTDKAVFHDYILPYAEVRFIRSRLKFGGCKDSAPFPSMLVIFRPPAPSAPAAPAARETTASQPGAAFSPPAVPPTDMLTDLGRQLGISYV